MPVGHLRCAPATPARAGRNRVGLERRIDQHEAAPLLRRHVGVERRLAVDRERLDARVAVQIAGQRRAGVRLELAGDQPVVRPQPARISAGEPG